MGSIQQLQPSPGAEESRLSLELFHWGEAHHFPQLVIGNDSPRREVIRAGEITWWVFTRNASTEQLARAMERARAWDIYER